MRILLTADPFLPVPPPLYGGIERIVAALLIGLQRYGHQVGLVAHPESRAAADFFLPWPEPSAGSPLAHARNMLALRRAVQLFHPSVVHSFSRLLYLVPFFASRIPKLMSYQRFVGGRQISLAASVAGSSIVFTGCSRFIATMGARSGGAWRAIPNFVDTDFYQLQPRVAADAPLLFLSRIEPLKGADLAIAVAKKTGRRLVLAGNHAEAGAERRYWDEVIKPEIGKNGIQYAGPVGDEAKRELLGAAAALIVPIQWDEPFGIVFAEALACGTPVITCPRGASSEIVRHGVEGFFMRDVEQGCGAVVKLDGIDRRACRARAEQAFSTAAVVPQYEELYDELLGKA
jgi:glycosyltransferase involved in cell wall biosynthesis